MAAYKGHCRRVGRLGDPCGNGKSLLQLVNVRDISSNVGKQRHGVAACMSTPVHVMDHMNGMLNQRGRIAPGLLFLTCHQALHEFVLKAFAHLLYGFAVQHRADDLLNDAMNCWHAVPGIAGGARQGRGAALTAPAAVSGRRLRRWAEAPVLGWCWDGPFESTLDLSGSGPWVLLRAEVVISVFAIIEPARPTPDRRRGVPCHAAKCRS
ncbi:hypothetical protein ACFYMW_29135 [Streptomyces sp. NPDC006692]|uniref:hypothetical protein n=1 Tax=Streptomyces sp. NPDC006692 TaxID=3364758 RepID=UPI0036C78409